LAFPRKPIVPYTFFLCDEILSGGRCRISILGCYFGVLFFFGEKRILSLSLNRTQSVLAQSNFDLWKLIGRLNHTIVQLRWKELSPYQIPVCQLYILPTKRTLGENAALSEVARQVERETHVISKPAVRMEKDGLIKRTKNTPKSNLFKLELTEKGLEMALMSVHSKGLASLFSTLSEEERRHFESILNKVLIRADAARSR
jgi:DNA-binding MarR family transcriptional regulator